MSNDSTGYANDYRFRALDIAIIVTMCTADNQVVSVVSAKDRSTLKSLAYDALPPRCMNLRDSSIMTNYIFTLLEYEDALSKSILKNLLWCICQLYSSSVSQHVPGWVVFISETGQIPKRLTGSADALLE